MSAAGGGELTAECVSHKENTQNIFSENSDLR